MGCPLGSRISRLTFVWQNPPMSGNPKQAFQVPDPFHDERPVEFAERLGHWYGQRVNDLHRKTFGLYFTPAAIAKIMAALCRGLASKSIRVLDPAAGTGILAAAACEAIAQLDDPPKSIELVCYELDADLLPLLNATLQHIEKWLSANRIELISRIEGADFLLANGASLENGVLPMIEEGFDAVICNPPYFKLAKSDPRSRACSIVIHGQPNIYGLFMAVGASVLREGGRFVFITPRSFASGSYFQRLREFFFRLVVPTDIHVFGSRSEAFEDVLQEAVIIAGTRAKGWTRSAKERLLRLTSSAGISDLDRRSMRRVPIGDVLQGDSRHRVLYLPANKDDDRVRSLVQGWKGSLHHFGWEVSTGPVVAFRAKQFLRDKRIARAIPLLWLQNVSAMHVTWPLESRKAQYLAIEKDADPIVLSNLNYVVLRRFSAKEEKRRLTAAPLLASSFSYQKIGLENHLNYINKPRGQLTIDETYGLSALFNSCVLDTYFRISNGSTQVNASELRSMPLPDISTIRRIGAQARTDPSDFESIVAREVDRAR